MAKKMTSKGNDFATLAVRPFYDVLRDSDMDPLGSFLFCEFLISIQKVINWEQLHSHRDRVQMPSKPIHMAVERIQLFSACWTDDLASL